MCMRLRGGEKTFFVEKGPFYLNEKAAIFFL